MKPIIFSSILLSVVILTSCNPTGWDQETKDNFIQGCTTTLQEKGIYTAQQMQSYCECALKAVIEKYPNQQDAVANGPTLHEDNGPQICREQYLEKK